MNAGDTKAAVCMDCHGIHGILPASHLKSKTFSWNIPDTCGHCHSDTEYMKDYTIPTKQNEEYRTSGNAE